MKIIKVKGIDCPSKYLIEVNGTYLFANNKEIAEKSSAYIQGYETDLEPRIEKFLDRFIGRDRKWGISIQIQNWKNFLKIFVL